MYALKQSMETLRTGKKVLCYQFEVQKKTQSEKESTNFDLQQCISLVVHDYKYWPVFVHTFFMFVRMITEAVSQRTGKKLSDFKLVTENFSCRRSHCKFSEY